MSTFHPESGDFKAHDDVRQALDNHHNHQIAQGHKADEYVKSELFPADELRKLLADPKIAGIRVYHARRWEDKDGKQTKPGVGKLTPRVVLVGVDAKGSKLVKPNVTTEVFRQPMLAFSSPPCPPECTPPTIA